jgi:hypothetical protein
MKKIFLSFIILSSAFPFIANAQNTFGEFYAVAEIGIPNKSLNLVENWQISTNDDNWGSTIGGSFGYRAFLGKQFLAGLEVTAAYSSGNTTITNAADQVELERKFLYGTYFTGGVILDRIYLYGLVGLGGTKFDATFDVVNSLGYYAKDTENIKGLSFGAAAEFQVTDGLGARFKVLHTNLGNGRVEEIQLKDTSFTAGLVFCFLWNFST